MYSADYLCVLNGGAGEIIEKKSRFIATVRPIATEEDAINFIEEMKKKYWDATHNCSAFVLGFDPELQRSSDDGEPQGTAGRPMLDALVKAGIRNTAVVVTRYFGGTLLGTGGLVRAYTEAVKAGLAASDVVKKTFGRRLMLKTDYNGIGKLQYLAETTGVSILTTEYTDTVVCTVFATPETENAFCKRVLEQTAGKTVITPLENAFLVVSDGKKMIFND